MPQPSRRKSLAGLATAGFAGCLSSSDGSQPDGSYLGEPIINNRHDAPHSVDFRVTWDGEVVHDRTYDIEANDPDDRQMPGALPEQTWPDERGQFTVSSRFSGEPEWQTIDPADAGYPDCFGVTVLIDRRGTLGIFTSEHPQYCSMGTATPDE